MMSFMHKQEKLARVLKKKCSYCKIRKFHQMHNENSDVASESYDK